MKKILRLVLGLSLTAVFGQTPDTFENPVLPGFYPDPSVVRVGEDYYMVNSSFEWFPGMPIHHSKDLVNWELIGYGLHRPDQVELPEGLLDSRGIYAVSIRYHDGLFYLITTCVKCNGNFYITAKNPAGPWSEPVWLGSRGIDPSLFWDDDGTCYYTGHANITGVNDWPNKNGVWMQVLDFEQQKLIGERKQLTHGHAKNARWTEGPHLYKIDGKYMLLVAEGGTGFHHAVTVHHSDSIWGPYIPNHSNPVLTHRHLGNDFPIHSVGHADLVQTQNGEWWSLMLAKRKKDGFSFLARETFLTPVRFEDQEGIMTPVFNPGIGHLQFEQTRPNLPWSPSPKKPKRDEFNTDSLTLEWNFLRTPYSKWYALKNGKLSIELRPNVLDSLTNPSLVARRIQHHDFLASTKMDFKSKKKNVVAGLVIYRNSTNHLQLLKEGDALILLKTKKGVKVEISRVPYPHKELVLQVEGHNTESTFRYGPTLNELKTLAEKVDLTVVSDEVAGGFNGPYVGMYATSNGKQSKKNANFDWFEYAEK
nr:glycoside hydrolase family 43 protein [Allomuricauda sp.]